MANKRITTRWLTGNLGIIVVILILIEIAFALGLRMFYYSAAQQALLSQATTVRTLLTRYAEDPSADFGREVRNLIENFEQRDRMELMAIDAGGVVTTTSSGFAVGAGLEMPDYHSALASPDGLGQFGGRLGSENVLAITVAAPPNDGSLSAVRLVASLSQVDSVVFAIIMAAVLFGVAIIFFMVLSGSYFISSIVIPVGEVTRYARRIAQGDFNTRLQKKTDDEIGELCETINYMAEELGNAERLKNEFISSVSHELRTPLTAIKGWSETILDSDVTDRETLEKGMRVIINESDRLSLMVEELLDFSRMQSGRLKLVIERIDALAELEEAVLMYTQKARRDGIELTYDETLKTAVVMADKNRLRQVFINIIDNAVKYSDPGGTVRVSAAQQGQTAVISVADSGCGISPQDLPRVKKKFYKANLTRRGSGIGLAVADEIVTAFKGSLELTSELGAGTTVTVRLPLATGHEAPQNGL